MTIRSGSDVVLVGGARTPFGKLNGALSPLSAVDLAAHAFAQALTRSSVPAEAVDTVLLGHVVQAGAGQGPARQAAIAAGIGWDVPATTINKLCLSGLTTVIDAARMIRCGDAEIVLAGGTESMSNGPHLLPRSRRGWAYGDFMALDSVAHDGLTDAFDQISMGASTERSIAAQAIPREEQDAVAAASHQHAAQAAADGIFADEIAPIPVPQRKGADLVVEHDEGVRGSTTRETLAALKPVFAPDGTITAGNSSPLSDGAAALVVTTRAIAEERGLTPLAVVGAYGQVAGPDNSLTGQPARAVERALERAELKVADLDFLEINEAFGAVVAWSVSELGYPLDQVNLHGGAIALGHPIGASGARLVLHAALELARRGSGTAAVSLCGGGGQGEALILLSP